MYLVNTLNWDFVYQYKNFMKVTTVEHGIKGDINSLGNNHLYSAPE